MAAKVDQISDSLRSVCDSEFFDDTVKVSKGAQIRNRYNQVQSVI